MVADDGSDDPTILQPELTVIEEGQTRLADGSSGPAGSGARSFGADGRYQVAAQLGKGGFGTVYKAYDRHLAKYVAIKTINVSDISPEDRPDYLRSFDNEAKAAARLEHPGVVTVLDYQPYTDEPYLVMPLVDSGTLQQALKDNPRKPWPLVLDLGLQLAEALHYAHRHGIQAHRDVKPANIFVASDGRYRVGDFGIARQKPAAGGGATQSIFVSAGTPRYMSPEQILAPRSVDARSDLFAVCVVLYEALTGRMPFRGVVLDFDPDEDPVAAQKIVDLAFADPVPIRKLVPDVPEAMARIIERGMARNPSDRFSDCAEFAAALRTLDVDHGKPRTIDYGGWARRTALLVGFAAVGVAGYAFAPDISTTVAGWYAALKSETVPVPSRERSEALAAQAEEFARDTWRQAEASLAEADSLANEGQRVRANERRRDATTLFRKAADEAWQARVAKVRTDVETAREEALGLEVRSDPVAAKSFEEGERQREQAVGLAGDNPRQSIDLLQSALKSYANAVRDGERNATRAGVNQLNAVKQILGKVPSLSTPPSELAREKETARELLAAIDRRIENGDFAGLRSELAAAESAVDALALETAKEARRRAERARSEARGPVSGDQEQRRASAERSYQRALDRMAQAKKAADLVEVVAVLTEAGEVFAALGSESADAARRSAAEAARGAAAARAEAEAQARAKSAAASPPAPPAQESAAFEVRLEPPADGVIVLTGGTGKQFWARTKERPVDYRWTFDGNHMSDADGNPGLEIEPSRNYREGLHTLKVTVSNGAGRDVTKQWMIRIGPDRSE